MKEDKIGFPKSFCKELDVFQYALDAVITVDSQSKILGWNQQAEKYFGWLKKEALGEYLPDLIIPKKYREDHLIGLKHFLKTGEGPILNKRIQIQALRRDGSEFDAELSVVPVQVSGKFAFHGFLRDISAEKRIDQLTRVQHEILSTLVAQRPSECLPEILKKSAITLGFDFATFWQLENHTNQLTLSNYSFINEETSLSKDFIQKSHAFTFIKGEGAPGRVWERNASLWVTNVAEEYNFPRRSLALENGIRGGVWFPVYVNETFYGVFEFLTHKKFTIDKECELMISGLSQLVGQSFDRERVHHQLEREKQQSNLLSEISINSTKYSDDYRLFDVFQKITDFSVSKLSDWCVVRINDDVLPPGLNTIVSHVNPTKKEMLKNFSKVFKGKKDEGANLVLSSGKPQMVNTISKDQLLFAAEDEFQKETLEKLNFSSWMGAPIQSDEKVYGVISWMSSEVPIRYFNHEDLNFLQEVGRRLGFIVKQHLSQLKLEEAKELALKANSAKSSFLANVSHEIRTPLGAILGFAEVLSNEKELTVHQAGLVKKVLNNGDHLLNLINDILDLSKAESDQISIDIQRISIIEVLADVLETANSLLMDRDVSINCEFVTDIPEWIYSDKTKLKQVLVNIIGNAIKFTDMGSIKINVYYSEDNKLKILVQDTGRGIKKQDYEKIFQPFQQGEKLINKLTPGTGLGLSLSRNIAEKLGGSLNLVVSKVGIGSTFEFSFRALPDEKSLWKSSINERQLSKSKGEVAADLSGKKILLVDDAKENQLYISLLLSQAGATVEVASSANEAFKLLEAHTFNLILMDIQMPEIDGWEATRMCRLSNITIPIVALSAHVSKEDKEKSFLAGCERHLSKPVNLQTLVKTILDLT